MSCVISWLRRKIPNKVHRVFLKIVFALGVLIVGLELAPIVSYVLTRCVMAPQGMWQKIVLALSYFRIMR